MQNGRIGLSPYTLWLLHESFACPMETTKESTPTVNSAISPYIPALQANSAPSCARASLPLRNEAVSVSGSPHSIPYDGKTQPDLIYKCNYMIWKAK